MNRKQSLRISVIFFLLGIMTTGAIFATARTNYTSACETCHTNTSSLSISSNATGSISATVDKSFVLIVEAVGYTRSDNRFVISLQDDWADNNEFTFTPTIIADGSAGDSNPTTNEIQASFTFTPQRMGSFTIRIYAASKGHRCAILDVPVDVTHWDTVVPTIDSPDDMQITEGDVSANVTWIPVESNPDRYIVFDNVTELESGAWDGLPIVVMLETLSLGTHTLTITIWDIAENDASDSVDVGVHSPIAPVIPDVADFSIPEGDTGNYVTWTPYDLHPSNYEIYENGTLLRTGLWNASTEEISSPIDGYSLGRVSYTLVVFDGEGMSASGDVTITIIDDTAPIVVPPDDIAYVENSQGHKITWTFFDLHPASYEVYKEETLVQSGIWNSTFGSIVFDVGGQSYGIYNYTLKLVDIGGNMASDDVQVIVFRTVIPIIFVHPDLYVSEGSSGVKIVWKPIDLNPDSYVIYRDGHPIRHGSWNDSSEVITISLDGNRRGVYNYTLVVMDEDFHTAYDEVLVTVRDDTLPKISSIPDISYTEGNLTTYIVEWEPSDTNPDYYRIFLDDDLYMEGPWNSSSEVFSIDVSQMPMGTYNYTLLVTDIASNSISDSVLVRVTDDTIPSFTTPEIVNISEGNLDTNISWILIEINPDNYELYIDEVLTRTGVWNSSLETFTISVNGSTLGIYNYTMIVFDTSNNCASSTIWVNVLDDISPIVNNPSDIYFDSSEIGNSISWDVYDLHLASYEVYRNSILYLSEELSENITSILVEIDGLNDGYHNFTLVIYDDSGNLASDCVWVSVLPIVTNPPTTPVVTGNPTGSNTTTDFVPDVPFQFMPAMSESFLAILSGCLILSVAVLGLFWIDLRSRR